MDSLIYHWWSNQQGGGIRGHWYLMMIKQIAQNNTPACLGFEKWSGFAWYRAKPTWYWYRVFQVFGISFIPSQVRIFSKLLCTSSTYVWSGSHSISKSTINTSWFSHYRTWVSDWSIRLGKVLCNHLISAPTIRTLTSLYQAFTTPEGLPCQVLYWTIVILSSSTHRDGRLEGCPPSTTPQRRIQMVEMQQQQ